MTLLYCLPIILYIARKLRFCFVTMKVCPWQFNVYFALVAALGLLCGCKTNGYDKHDKPMAALRVCIESAGDTTGDMSTVQTISVLRDDPVLLTIQKEPILTEANVLAARVITTPGGFAVEIRFDETGAYILEQYSAAFAGKHFAIFGQWGDKTADGRWLTAQLITHRIADGVLAFTPDMSHAEADQFVLGLNNAAKEFHKDLSK